MTDSIVGYLREPLIVTSEQRYIYICILSFQNYIVSALGAYGHSDLARTPILIF